MSAVLWFIGLWLLISLPRGMFLGWVCSLNNLTSDELLIVDELRMSDEPPMTTAPAAHRPALTTVGIAA